MIKKLRLLFTMTIVTLAIALGAASPVYQNEDGAWFLSVANALQMTVPDLKTALANGQTLDLFFLRKHPQFHISEFA